MRTTSRRLVGLICLILTACGGHQSPQRPSQWLGKSPEPDSVQLRLMELNQQMAAEADKELLHYVQTHEEAYALYLGNVWVHIWESGNDELTPYNYGQSCPLHLRIYSMDGKTLLADMRRSFQLGSNDTPYGVTEVVRELYPGARARLLAPWYSAYGIQGNGYVEPYQNVIIDLTIEE